MTTYLPAGSRREPPTILYDGVCGFCNASVNFIIDRDRAGRIRFAAQQSAAGEAIMQRYRLDAQAVQSLVLIDGGRAYLKSTAAVRIARHLDWPWAALAVFAFLPPILRDEGYDLIARNRYLIYGRLDACRIPTPDVRARFLE